ncbi:unnamed protein product, partial [Mesorhabditis spiculigera]
MKIWHAAPRTQYATQTGVSRTSTRKAQHRVSRKRYRALASEEREHFKHSNLDKRVVLLSDSFLLRDVDICLVSMPYINGMDLTHFKYGDGGLELSELAHIYRQVGIALDMMHNAGVVHLDIKPDNILLIKETDILRKGMRTQLRKRKITPNSGKSGFALYRSRRKIEEEHFRYVLIPALKIILSGSNTGVLQAAIIEFHDII